MKPWRTVADLNHIGIQQFIPHKEHSLSPLLRIISECSWGKKLQRIVETHEILSAQFFNVLNSVLQMVTCTWSTHVLGQFNLLKPTGYVMHHQFNIRQLRSAHTVFMCFVFIWGQTATCITYSINWSVFITEMKSVYCAVRTVFK